MLLGVGQQETSLFRVARVAAVYEIFVLGDLRSIASLRNEMVEVEFAGVSPPAFSKQAVRTTKGKLITKPRAIRFVAGVPGRSVTPMLSRSRIGESKRITAGCHGDSEVVDHSVFLIDRKRKYCFSSKDGSIYREPLLTWRTQIRPNILPTHRMEKICTI